MRDHFITIRRGWPRTVLGEVPFEKKEPPVQRHRGVKKAGGPRPSEVGSGQGWAL